MSRRSKAVLALGVSLLLGLPSFLVLQVPSAASAPISGHPASDDGRGSGHASATGRSISAPEPPPVRMSGSRPKPAALPTPAGVLPRYAGENNWFNVTGLMGTGPAGFAGMMAFDPLLGTQGGEMVYFGGCDAGTGCLSNVTWLYDGGSWTEVTTGAAPPATEFGMMAYDPDLSGVLLVGGENGSGGSLADIWSYSSLGWTNLTGSSWATGMPTGGLAKSTMAWDPALSTMLIVDGCSGPTCAVEYEGAWTLDATGFTAISPPLDYLEGAAMAWDAADGVMLLFGGDLSGAARNTTWVLNGTTWSLLNIPPSQCAPLCETPPAMSDAVMTWDSQLDSVLLFAGINLTDGLAYNTTWTFSLQTGWFNTTGFDSFANPPPTYYPEMAVDSTDQAPLLIEGGCIVQLTNGCLGQEQVFDYAPDPLPAPNLTLQVDVGVPASFSYVEPADFGSGPWEVAAVDFGDAFTGVVDVNNLTNGSGFAVTFDHTYTAVGTYALNLSVDDFFYVQSGLSLNLTVVAAPTIRTSILPSPTEVGTLVHFVANLTLGTPPYTYNWSFGDGASSPNASANHSYGLPGLYTANLTATDAADASVNLTFPVRVYPQLAATVHARYVFVDSGVNDSFSVAPSGGSGTYTYENWSFGDGGAATGLTTAHSYTSTSSRIFNLSFAVTDSAHFERLEPLAIAVNPALDANPTSSPSQPSAMSPIVFAAGPIGGTSPFTYAWLFGDGSASQAASPSHTYAHAGSYIVYLWVNDSGGGSVEKSFQLTVGAAGSQAGSGPAANGWLLEAVVGLAIAAAAVAAFLLLRRRKASPASTPAAPPPPWAETPPPPPGAR